MFLFLEGIDHCEDENINAGDFNDILRDRAQALYEIFGLQVAMSYDDPIDRLFLQISDPFIETAALLLVQQCAFVFNDSFLICASFEQPSQCLPGGGEGKKSMLKESFWRILTIKERVESFWIRRTLASRGPVFSKRKDPVSLWMPSAISVASPGVM